MSFRNIPKEEADFIEKMSIDQGYTVSVCPSGPLDDDGTQVELDEIDKMMGDAIHDYPDKDRLKIASGINNLPKGELLRIVEAYDENRVKIYDRWTKENTCGVCKHFQRDPGERAKGVCLKRFKKQPSRYGYYPTKPDALEFSQVLQSTMKTMSCPYERDESIVPSDPTSK